MFNKKCSIKCSTKNRGKLGILHEAKDWVTEIDLDQQI